MREALLKLVITSEAPVGPSDEIRVRHHSTSCR